MKCDSNYTVHSEEGEQNWSQYSRRGHTNTLYNLNMMSQLLNSKGAELSMVAITKEKVLVNLIGLKVDKSPVPDGLHPRVRKEKAEEVVEALVVIFQESLESGRVPEDW
eukprot:g27130.t1